MCSVQGLSKVLFNLERGICLIGACLLTISLTLSTNFLALV